MEFENKDIHKIAHSYMPTIIIPYVAVSNNWQFLVDKSAKEVITSDNVHCEVLKCNIFNICMLEDEIKKIYGITPWEFIQKWYRYDNNISSLCFIRLELKRK